VAAKKRSGMMPDVPTMSEAGVKDFEVPRARQSRLTAASNSMQNRRCTPMNAEK